MLIEIESKHNRDAEGIELITEIEEISILVFYFKFTKSRRVLAFERMFSMMLLLAENILYDLVNLRVTIGKCTVTFLPTKIELCKSLIFDKSS